MESNRPSIFEPTDTFVRRHVGPTPADVQAMLGVVEAADLDELVGQTIPDAIRLEGKFTLGYQGAAPLGEQELLESLSALAQQNQVFRSFIGMGYYECITPGVIGRNVFQNPAWYTQYTPYQAEISQGRLEALLNFQTMVADLCGLPLANASLLDEGTAAAEALHMAYAQSRGKKAVFFVADDCHPQTIAVVQTRAEALDIEVRVGDPTQASFDGVAGVLIQYPSTDGRIVDVSALTKKIHEADAMAVVATDLLALCLLEAPGVLGADVCVGSAQRFGVPLGYGGPHAAFLACREELKRQLPGRIIGVSKDARGKQAYRMAMQTREQHIRRERATSNICTAQVLLAIMAGMYGVYHGPDGLRSIARRVHGLTKVLAAGISRVGHTIVHDTFFDTIRVRFDDAADSEAIYDAAIERRVNLRRYEDGSLGVSLDEATTKAEIETLLSIFAQRPNPGFSVEELAQTPECAPGFSGAQARTAPMLEHPVFHSHRSETEMLRYIFKLAGRDLSLTQSMIPLGSCTMKLNATAEMVPVSWPEFADIHPFAPLDQTEGYQALFRTLERWLADITGFSAVSLQPNAGAQGEYTGLMVIRALHRANGQAHRNVCLIPVSAHGTNPASAVLAGMKVVVVKCDDHGNIDMDDLRAKADKHAENLAACMVTYPSTHGVFESAIKEVCSVVHRAGGRVYMDGANMNAQVGLCRPGDFGADVCHLNLHKTFCIPHGGGGPGMGPIGVTDELAPYLPGHPVVGLGTEQSIGPVSAAPWGSASILPISWVYIALMGAQGLAHATKVAILNANYMAKRLGSHYPVLYTGESGRVAHEFIIDLRPFKAAGIENEDVAKRLMDYGYHAPTMSFPVSGTLMIEPTESESKAELDRFCDAMIQIREEIRKVEDGTWPADDNPLKHAPHTADVVMADAWDRPYSREVGAFPLPYVRDHKFWPHAARVDNAYGDRNLICTCPPLDAYEE